MQSVGDSFYRDGLFPTERAWYSGTHVREDNNIFFSALIALNLSQCRSKVAIEDQLVIDSILQRVRHVFPYYQNRNGDITYNFYQTRPDMPFPNLKFFSKKKKFRLPDDMDDTSIIYYTQNSSDSIIKVLKSKMEEQALKMELPVRSTPKRYHSYRVYPTWFAHKMKQDIDICVLANTLYLVASKRLPITSIDSQSYGLIYDMIIHDDHIKRPHLISPHYKNTAVILYHIARLMSIDSLGFLQSIRGKLTIDIKKRLASSIENMERVILLSSLYRLGIPYPYTLEMGKEESGIKSFSFFYGNPFSFSPVWMKKIIHKSNLFQFKYRNEAYNWSLLMELSILSNAQWDSHKQVLTAP